MGMGGGILQCALLLFSPLSHPPPHPVLHDKIKKIFFVKNTEVCVQDSTNVTKLAIQTIPDIHLHLYMFVQQCIGLAHLQMKLKDRHLSTYKKQKPSSNQSCLCNLIVFLINKEIHVSNCFRRAFSKNEMQFSSGTINPKQTNKNEMQN